jgi:hypothetical protein
MSDIRTEARESAHLPVCAIFRWESALVIALTLVLFFPGRAAFRLVAALRLAAVGRSRAGSAGLLQPDRR